MVDILGTEPKPEEVEFERDKNQLAKESGGKVKEVGDAEVEKPSEITPLQVGGGEVPRFSGASQYTGDALALSGKGPDDAQSELSELLHGEGYEDPYKLMQRVAGKS